MALAGNLLKLLQSFFSYLLPLAPVEELDRVTYRKHWYALLRSILAPLVVVLGVFFGWVYLLTSGRASLLMGYGWWLVVGLGLSLLPFLWFIWRYENWRNDYYVVTDDRIIDVKKLPFGFRTDLREAPLANVQNLSLRLPNILAAALDFGDIEVDTAGRQGQLAFRSIHHPRRVLSQVSSRLAAYQARRATQEREQREQEILGWFKAYTDLGRVAVLRSPHQVEVAQPVEVEWRISGQGNSVITGLRWDVLSRPDNDYSYSYPVQSGGTGNYALSFLAPLGGKLFFRVFAEVDGSQYCSAEHSVPVSDFQISYPKEVRPSESILISWRMQAVGQDARILWDTFPQKDGLYRHVLPAKLEAGRYSATLSAPQAESVYFRLAVIAPGGEVFSPEFTVRLAKEEEAASDSR